MEMIRVENLGKRFGNKTVLRDVSFTVEKGETVAVIGPSGTGKSTMLRCLIDLETAEQGSIHIADRPLIENGAYPSAAARRAATAPMGMVFQNFNLFPHMNVMENLIISPVTVEKEPREQAIARAAALLDEVGLADKAEASPSSLSGGEKQRVAIARALMRDPALLLFDEPTSALDPQLTGEVLGVMRRLHEKKMTMIVVTHEMGFAREAADKILFMSDGRIVEQGPPEEIFERPQHARVKSFIDSIINL